MTQLGLPLAAVGWVFAILSAAALVAGALLIIAMHRAGELQRRFLAASAWNDMALFGIWILGLAGGIGVIQLRPWGRDLLEFFCWTLMALVVLSAGQRLYAFKRLPREGRVSWTGAVAGVLVVLMPVISICAAALITLRSDAARAVFSG